MDLKRGNRVFDAVEGWAHSEPQRPALTSPASAFTYGELASKVADVERALVHAGVDATTPVGVLCENCAELVLLYYAIGKLGGTFVPINPSLSFTEVAYIIENAELRVLFHDVRMEPVATAAHAMRSSTQLVSLAEFFGADPKKIAPNLETSETQANDNFLIIYTSGSTGTPKAVLFDQGAEVAGNASLIEMWGMGPRDVTVVALPLGFLYGLSTATATALQAGGEVVVLSRFHPREVLEAFVERKATVFQGVPTMFAMMLEYAEQNGISMDLSSMRLLISAGAPLSQELRLRFEARFQKRIDDYYALTEVRPVFGRHWGDEASMPSTAIGRAAPGAVIKILDTDGREAAPGRTGELFVRAPSTLRSYWKNERLSQEVFVDGLFRTGDIGYCDHQGFYHLTGRIKDIIIRGGANIAPAEVEAVVESHPAIRGAAVIGVPDEKFGEIVVAFFVSRADDTPDAKQLNVHCRGSLAEFKVPQHFLPVREFPLGITGKVDKKALLRQWMEMQA